ncbi:hypothetical protein HDU83_002213 [Entophlyctis luteolus]|nr:hypothetical protein HDU83_002213 [Entophlyctis luteolus]KAJ3388558.1 hypothetical protein HDU84_009656 [Entophlyctis sp. JEL0112]
MDSAIARYAQPDDADAPAALTKNSDNAVADSNATINASCTALAPPAPPEPSASRRSPSADRGLHLMQLRVPQSISSCHLLRSNHKLSSVENFEKEKHDLELIKKREKAQLLAIQEQEAFEKSMIAKQKLEADIAAKRAAKLEKIALEEAERARVLEEQRLHMEQFEAQKILAKQREEEHKAELLRAKEAEAFARLEELKKKKELDEAKKAAFEEEKRQADEAKRSEKLRRQQEAMAKFEEERKLKLMSTSERDLYLAQKELERLAKEAELEKLRLEEQRVAFEAAEKERLELEERLAVEAQLQAAEAPKDEAPIEQNQQVDHTETACCAKSAKCILM